MKCEKRIVTAARGKSPSGTKTEELSYGEIFGEIKAEMKQEVFLHADCETAIYSGQL